MKFFYNSEIAESVIKNRKHLALDDDDIKRIPLYKANDFLIVGYEAGLVNDAEPIADFEGPSFKCADFANEEEARRELCFILNRDIAETYFDL